MRVSKLAAKLIFRAEFSLDFLSVNYSSLISTFRENIKCSDQSSAIFLSGKYFYLENQRQYNLNMNFTTVKLVIFYKNAKLRL